MASVELSNVAYSSATNAAQNASNPSGQLKAQASESASLKPDTVKLSTAAQVKLMHRQGQTPALIAATLGTNVSTIDGYLGIKVVAPATASTAPAATEQAEPAAKSATAESAAPTTQAPQNPPTAANQSSQSSAASPNK